MTATLAPRPPEGMAAGAAISVAAHAGLVAALAFAVNWRLPAPQPVAAELWSAVPRAAAPAEAPTPPPPVTPPPTEPSPAAPPQPQAPTQAPPPARRDADIALERERQQQRERERQEKAAQQKAAQETATREREARQKAAQEKAAQEKTAREKAAQEKSRREKAEREKAERAEEARVARQREENLKRLMGQIPAGSTSGSGAGTAAVDAAPSAAYAGRLVQAIFPNIVFTETLPGNPAAVVEVRAGPQGSIIGRRLVSSSGHKDWDEAVLRAIDRTATLPRDVDGRVPPVITITFRPR
ncbi:MAG: hypothetical protein RI988_589 [Pseudomonadota bacterium]|jgi:colicin import membrane protein